MSEHPPQTSQEDSEPFRNRRDKGKKPAAAKHKAGTADTRPRPTIRRLAHWSWRPHRPSKRGIVIGAITVGALTVTIVVADILTLQAYQHDTDSLNRQRNQLISYKSTDASLKKAAPAAANQQACQPASAYQTLAPIFANTSAVRTDCQHTLTDLHQLAAQLQTLLAAQSYLQQTHTILAKPLAPSGEAFANIITSATDWQTARTAMITLNAPAPYHGVHAELQKAITTVTDAWQRLAKANSDHDAAAFKTAETDLASGYEKLRAYDDTLNGITRRLQQQLQAQLVKK